MKSSKGQLVSQHLENVSREALEKYQDIIKDYVRRRQGIYALFRRNRLYYVGLASNLRNRLKHHLKDRHAQTWDRFSVYLTIKDEHMHELEALVLRIASPKGNRQTGKLVRSQDLRPEFKRAIHKFHQKEIKAIFGQSEKESTEIVKLKAKDGRQPVLSSYVSKRFEIRLRFKGKSYKAIVRKDGSILYEGKTYNSPSLAGRAIKGRATNGWTTWKYERAPGDWVLLDILRKK
jgi:predicted GIY-YIG superfamily endonuclease